MWCCTHIEHISGGIILPIFIGNISTQYRNWRVDKWKEGGVKTSLCVAYHMCSKALSTKKFKIYFLEKKQQKLRLVWYFINPHKIGKKVNSVSMCSGINCRQSCERYVALYRIYWGHIAELFGGFFRCKTAWNLPRPGPEFVLFSSCRYNFSFGYRGLYRPQLEPVLFINHFIL